MFPLATPLPRKKAALYARLAEIRKQEEQARKDYIADVERTIRRNPNHEARYYAELLGSTEQEINSIEQSIISMACAAVSNRLHPRNQVKASIPMLDYKYITKVRHFAELNDDGEIINRFDKEVKKRIYFINND